MIASRYFLWFLLYSLFGWLFECVYGVIVTKKWENRGFLHGPIVPIYGVGAVVITALYDILRSRGINLAGWQIFLVAFFGSMVLEYSTSWFLEKRFHAVWWDYSNMPFNLNGRICLPAATAFGLAGLLVTKVTAPLLKNVTMSVPMILVETFSLVVMFILAADMTLTVSALTGFADMVGHVEDDINTYMAALVDKAVAAGSAMQDKAVSAGSAVQDKVVSAGSAVQDKVVSAGNAVQDKASAAGTVIVDKASTARSAFAAKVASAVSQRKDGEPISNVLTKEDKEGLFAERMENILNNTDSAKLHALKRVRGFRFEKTDMAPQQVAYINRAHKMLKKTMSRRKNKKNSEEKSA